MLKSCIRNATAAARPVKTSGVASVSVSVQAALPSKAAVKIRRYVRTGSWPVRTSTRAISTNATPTDRNGTA
jgi:hypothetical protein